MASLYQPTYTRKLPDGTREKCRCKVWWGKWRDKDGRERREALSRNRKAAQVMLAEKVKAAEMGVATTDPYAEHRKRPLAEHLKEWEAELRARGNTPRSVALTVGRARRLIDGCGWAKIADVSASAAESWLATHRTAGASVQTSNHYLSAVQQFMRWLVRDLRTDVDPLRRLDRGNVAVDRRHVRRALTDDELALLLGSLPARPVLRDLSGEDRRMLYLTALYTGLRAAELSSLTPASFDLAAGTVTVEAERSKHRKRDVLPLHPALALELSPWLTGRSSDAPLWPGPWAANREAGKLLRADLAAAGVLSETAAGVADFHSFRVTFVTRVVRSGIAPKLAQRLARHADIRLTLETYTRMDMADDTAAMNAVPPIGQKPPAKEPPADGAPDAA